MVEMDAETVRVIADLARKRAAAHLTYPEGDALVRHGAIGALRQLAVDLEVSADALEPRRRR